VDALVIKWPEEAGAIFCCGMITSTIGWENVPYLQCPISATDLAATLPILEIGAHRLHVSPGLSCQSIYGQPDVMRGEEIQYLGYLSALPEGGNTQGMICMPGTHSKWLSVEKGEARHFSTTMTGDVFEALSQNGLLRTHLTEAVTFSSAFIEGLEYARSGGSLARQLFSVRSRVVIGDLENEDAASYASGILIGSEIVDVLDAYADLIGSEAITLIGSRALCDLYKSTLEHFGQSARIIESHDACIDGFRLLGRLKAGQ
jgi:2-dehydro-3-deoxygalactonokinase